MDSHRFTAVHCIGIGGIGVSALAAYFTQTGARVTGSDLAKSLITERLREQGVSVSIGKHVSANIPERVDLVVYSPAIPEQNAELSEARQRVKAVLSYPECAALLMRGHKKVVVSGTHGKSTTTAMVGCILLRAELDPSVIVGSLVPQLGGNVRVGKGDPFVIEGDEYRRSFYAYSPDILVITNIEPDHLDVYKDIGEIEEAFRLMVSKVPAEGVLIANASDSHVKKIIKGRHTRVHWFGPGTQESELGFSLRVPGEHNILNALAARAVGRELSVSDTICADALSSFEGIWRRFQIRGIFHGITIIDDYAHHPTEIRSTLQAARGRFPHSRIVCVFQPHQRHRTHVLFREFIRAFDDADVVVLTDIYSVAGRDEKSYETSADLANALSEKKPVILIKELSDIPRDLRPRLQEGDVVIMMGAGTIISASNKLIEMLNNKKTA